MSMSSASVVSLIGMPGVGKTSVGRRLSRLIGMSFIDSDHEIERRLGVSIPGYFREHGEVAFRDVEEQVIGEFASLTGHVLATGGGTVLRAPNREVLQGMGAVIYLRSSAHRLAMRMRGSTRPLMAGHDPMARIAQLLRERSHLYEQTARLIVDVDGQSVQSVAERIADAIHDSAFDARSSRVEGDATMHADPRQPLPQ